jgi:hypothetical protein
MTSAGVRALEWPSRSRLSSLLPATPESAPAASSAWVVSRGRYLGGQNALTSFSQSSSFVVLRTKDFQMSNIQSPPVEAVIDADDYDEWLHELWRFAYREAAMTSANAAIRSALLINVLIAVVMLAFIAGFIAGFGSWNVVPVSELAKIASSLMLFASGVALTCGTAAVVLFANYCIAIRCATAFQFVAFLCALSSLLAFTVGTIFAFDAAVALQDSVTPNSPAHLLPPN